MSDPIGHPLFVFLIAFVAMWLAARAGVLLCAFTNAGQTQLPRLFDVIQAATLTLLALIISFSFSMAIERYDQRKNYEEAEANAIGTEYLRLDLLPANDAAKVRELLVGYVAQRISFYSTAHEAELRNINDRTSKTQAALWSAVAAAARAEPTPVMALVVNGMNDVLNSQGYTQAAWWNRIPHTAWGLMAVIALCCNVLVGYGARDRDGRRFLLAILPLIVSISFVLIADIDSPRGGLIHVAPQNLTALAQSLNASH
ncbi:hypothetical protein AWB75_05318 [Caballeronia catudaia]|uniref:DUF4239 domain-containing protein n=1 Tax=Caballeronia catudaia TaxID=1777136 RepID=A0A158CLV3_9BURK|nr:hypothetical protein [Caballeronia catudaia]SAK82846.1 hypothetical protein AWB75_05318 [Caballeronia catudaia]